MIVRSYQSLASDDSILDAHQLENILRDVRLRRGREEQEVNLDGLSGS